MGPALLPGVRIQSFRFENEAEEGVTNFGIDGVCSDAIAGIASVKTIEKLLSHFCIELQVTLGSNFLPSCEEINFLESQDAAPFVFL